MTGMSRIQENQLMTQASLITGDWLMSHAERIKLKVGQVLHEPDDVMQYVYFPDGSIVSLLHVMESGDFAETAVIDQLFGPEARELIQARIADVAEIPMQALAQVMNQLGHLPFLAVLANLAQARADQAPVVVLRNLLAGPVVQTLALVQRLRGLAPATVVHGLLHVLHEFALVSVHRLGS